jgi:hypothetical protein
VKIFEALKARAISPVAIKPALVIEEYLRAAAR